MICSPMQGFSSDWQFPGHGGLLFSGVTLARIKKKRSSYPYSSVSDYQGLDEVARVGVMVCNHLNRKNLICVYIYIYMAISTT